MVRRNFLQTLFTALRRSPNAEHSFAALALVFGIGLLALVPPFKAADEPYHFFRAYQVSTLNVAPDERGGRHGAEIPTQIVEMADTIYIALSENHQKSPTDTIARYAHQSLQPDAVKWVEIANVLAYPPTVYAPQAIGIAVAKVFGGSMLTMFYTSRVVNFMVWLAICYFAIRLIPVGKWLMVVLCLTPASLYQATSASADAITNALACLGVSVFMFLYLQKTKITPKQTIGAIAVLSLLGISKFVYASVIFLFASLPRIRFGHTRSLFIKLALLAIPLLVTGMWLLSIRSIDPVGHIPQAALANKPAQIKHIISNPLEFTNVLYRTHLTPESDHLWQEFWGMGGVGEFAMPLWAYGLLLILVFVSAFSFEIPKAPDPTFRALAIGVFISIFLIISATLYITFTAVGAPTIAGLQGRYYIPLSMLLIPLIYGSLLQRHIRVTLPFHAATITTGLVVALTVFLFTIYGSFHLPLEPEMVNP